MPLLLSDYGETMINDDDRSFRNNEGGTGTKLTFRSSYFISALLSSFSPTDHSLTVCFSNIANILDNANP